MDARSRSQDVDAAGVRRRSFEIAVVVVAVALPTVLLLARHGLAAPRGPVSQVATLAATVGLLWSWWRSRRGDDLERVMPVPWALGLLLLAVLVVESPFVLAPDALASMLSDIEVAMLVVVSAGYLTLTPTMARRGAVAALLVATVGVVLATVRRGEFSTDVTTLLLATVVVVLIDANGRVAASVARSEEEARVKALLADHDALTGLRNRRGIESALAERWPIGVMLVDLDRFKSINDRLGHATGDAVLRAVAVALRSTVRDDDLVGRWGGEEFLVLADARDPAALGERVRAAVAAAAGPEPVTASVGVALPSGAGDTPDEALRRADAALYRAKDAGRDLVIVADPAGPA
jgi:diguanylate cyclase (GGDEF)-like protein